jgi:Acetyltransferase (isoleucine patch superfamily)
MKKILILGISNMWMKMKNHYATIDSILYNKWIRSQIKYLGKNSFIGSKCNIHGGAIQNISIGDNSRIENFSVLECWSSHHGIRYSPQITIGNNSAIGEYCHISAIKGVFIGNGVLTGRYVYISDNHHGDTNAEALNLPPHNRSLFSKGEVHIHDNVWLGDRVSVFSGVTIGEGAVIGANAVVTHDIPAYSIAVGVPAKVIKIVNTR